MPFARYTWRGEVRELAALERRLRKLNVKGATSGNLSRILAGKYSPGYELVKGLATVLDVSLEEVGEFIDHCRRMNAKMRAFESAAEDEEAAN
jgi:transcriptional regulator with XRE-family HTH domain